MRCEEVLNRLWEYLDLELEPEEAASVAEHLDGCSDCYPAYRCDRAFLLLLARLRVGATTPPGLARWVRTLV